MHNTELTDRFRGCLVGLAVGDAVGTTVGFMPPGSFAPVTDMVGGGPFAEIAGTGYVVHSLEAALWAFHRAQSFREGCLLAVNLGDDADTTAAIYGQLAGAFYGASGIPAAWVARLAMRELLESYADTLLGLSEEPHGA
jgi:ADP-ribosylglycohydrolase